MVFPFIFTFYAPSVEKMRVSNSSLFIFHQTQVGFQHHPYRDPDFPLSHNVLWAVLQSRHCIIIMSFCKMVMWIVSKQELKDRVICPCLMVGSQFTLREPFALELLCGGGSAGRRVTTHVQKALKFNNSVHKPRLCLGAFSLQNSLVSIWLSHPFYGWRNWCSDIRYDPQETPIQWQPQDW